MKVITISLSNECLKDPPCPFCFQADRRRGKADYPPWEMYGEVRKIADEKWKNEEVTFCFEYNGYHISEIGNTWRYTFRGQGGRPDPGTHFTMTTYPEIVTGVFAGFVKNGSPIEAVALSYDSAKVSSDVWYLGKVHLLKEAGLNVSCNFLLEPKFKFPEPDFLKHLDQLNLLSLKPTGQLPSGILHLVRSFITMANSILPVTTDNCLAVQLGTLKECRRGKDFLHVTAGGEILDCCFLDKCFLYKE